jgi:hypothetical protein
MKHAAIALLLTLAPVHAEETPTPGEGLNLMQEGAKLLFRGLMSEMEPALDSMGEALTEMEPALRDLMEMVGDFRNYEPPVKLPNGDILIRRKPDTPPPPGTQTPDMSPDADIEL